MTAPVSLPASCEVEALAEWLYETAQAAHPRGTSGFRETPWDRLGPDGRQQTRETARAVRALVECMCVRAVIAYDEMANGDLKLDDVIASVLGSES